MPRHRVAGRIARLSISNKLLIGYLASVLPVAVLVLFVSGSFGQDMAAVRRELGGIAYAGRVLMVHQTVTELQVGQNLLARNMLMADLTGKDPVRQREITAREIDSLDLHHQLNADALGLSAESLAGRGLEGISAPVLIERLRANMDGSGLIEPGIAESLRLLSDTVLNLTGVTQDPALDSNALIRAILVHLPEMQRYVGDALLVLASYSSGPDVPIIEMTTMALQAFSSVLRNVTDRRISSLIELGIREDSENFSEHKEVQDLLSEHLEQFLTASSRFVTLLTPGADRDDFVAGDMVIAGIDAWDASAALFEVGLLGI